MSVLFPIKIINRFLTRNIKITVRNSYKAYPTLINRFHAQIPACTLSNKTKIVSYHRSYITAMDTKSNVDPSSFAQPDLHLIKHISLKWDVDFSKKVLRGKAILTIDILNNSKPFVLDSLNLNIESVTLEDGTKCEYKIHPEVKDFGSKFTIDLPAQLPNNETMYSSRHTKMPLIVGLSNNNEIRRASQPSETSIEMNLKDSLYVVKVPGRQIPTEPKRFRVPTITNVVIAYSTSPSASALQWLEPQQTAGKTHPYLFSQCQPIHARSIVPCQDTPAVKFTYDAEVTAPPPHTVLMSALKQEAVGSTNLFDQPVPIPSYLLAIAVGVLTSKKLGPRSTIWSEAPVVEAAAWEFEETENYLQAAEKLCGKYVWSQYDLLVLPPSFPYGGMENPCLTFVTPTLLAGDRSQANVIVHEIMHSWTGNLVTNKNFEHFWLNEGFTVFLERKVAASLIKDKVKSDQNRDFQSILGLQELTDTIKSQFQDNDALTSLVVDLKGVHPDDAFSRVPYEKGSLFLRVLEDLVGGPEVFDKFMLSYLNQFQRQSIDTDQFKQYLLDYFKDNEDLKKFDFDQWFFTPGMPPSIPKYDTTMSEAITKLVEKISIKNPKFSYDDVKDFMPSQLIHFLQVLIDSPPMSTEDLQSMGSIYQVDSSKNTEIEYRWYRLCIKSKDSSKLKAIFNFVNKQGRMKYVRPLYRDLYAWEEVRPQAIQNFRENEENMMHVSAYTIRKDLKLNTDEAAVKA